MQQFPKISKKSVGHADRFKSNASGLPPTDTCVGLAGSYKRHVFLCHNLAVGLSQLSRSQRTTITTTTRDAHMKVRLKMRLGPSTVLTSSPPRPSQPQLYRHSWLNRSACTKHLCQVPLFSSKRLTCCTAGSCYLPSFSAFLLLLPNGTWLKHNPGLAWPRKPRIERRRFRERRGSCSRQPVL